MLENWAGDVRYTLRRLRSRPTYAALTVLTRLLQPGARGALRNEGRISTHPRAAAGGARQVPSAKSALQRNQ